MEINKKSKLVTNNLLVEIKSALTNIKGWGSVEIFVQNGQVTQITQRSIKKTNHSLDSKSI